MSLKCRECIHSRKVPGDTHLSCNRPSVAVSGVSEHGLNKGWFMFPINFDPMWAESCTGFVSKDEKLEDYSKEELDKLFFVEIMMMKKMMDVNFQHVSVFSKDKLTKNLELAQNSIQAKELKDQTKEEVIHSLTLFRNV